MAWTQAKKAGLFVVIILFILVISLVTALLNTMVTNAMQPLEPEDLGQGIYSLNVDLNSNTETEVLKKSLVKFRQNHPDLKITAISPSKQDGYGVIKGVIIITEPK